MHFHAHGCLKIFSLIRTNVCFSTLKWEYSYRIVLFIIIVLIIAVLYKCVLLTEPHISSNCNGTTTEARLAERSKAPDLSSGSRLGAWVRTPHLAKIFFFFSNLFNQSVISASSIPLCKNIAILLFSSEKKKLPSHTRAIVLQSSQKNPEPF